MVYIARELCIMFTSERIERSSYLQSYMGHLDDSQTALKSFRKSEKIEIHFYDHLGLAE